MGPAGEFEVGSVNAFGEDPAVDDMNSQARAAKAEQQAAAQPRNLDLELGDMVVTESSGAAGADAAAGAAPDSLSLHLELQGLSPDLARQLQALFGKVIELPAMRIRIKGDDIA
jgi:hypothetical protein